MSQASRIGVFGCSGSGKTSFMFEVLKGKKRVVVLDPEDEYDKAGFTRVETINQVRDAIVSKPRDFRVTLVPRSGHEGTALHQLSDLVWRLQKPFADGKSNLVTTIVVDEMQLSFPLHGADNIAPKFGEICSRGRKRGINAYGVSQMISGVSPRFRGNSRENVILQQIGHNNIKAAANLTGMTSSEIDAIEQFQYVIVENKAQKWGRTKK